VTMRDERPHPKSLAEGQGLVVVVLGRMHFSCNTRRKLALQPTSERFMTPLATLPRAVQSTHGQVAREGFLTHGEIGLRRAQEHAQFLRLRMRSVTIERTVEDDQGIVDPAELGVDQAKPRITTSDRDTRRRKARIRKRKKRLLEMRDGFAQVTAIQVNM